MVGEAHITILAFGHPTAGVALHHGSKPSAVLKENDLLFTFQTLPNMLEQERSKGTFHPLGTLQFLDVQGHNLRQFYLPKTLLELHKGILMGDCSMIPALQGGSGCTQKGTCTIPCRQHQGGIACVVAGSRVLLLVGVFVLLIHDDQSQALEGEENGGAHPENNFIGAVRELLLPDFYPFCIGKFGVINTHAGTKDFLQTLGNLCRKRYLGQEIQHLPSLLQLFANEMDVYLRLSRGGDPMEQTDGGREKSLTDGVIGTLLGGTQRMKGDIGL